MRESVADLAEACLTHLPNLLAKYQVKSSGVGVGACVGHVVYSRLAYLEVRTCTSACGVVWSSSIVHDGFKGRLGLAWAVVVRGAPVRLPVPLSLLLSLFSITPCVSLCLCSGRRRW